MRILQQANAHFAAGDYDKARIEYLNVLKLDAKNAGAIENLGLLWLEQGSPIQAYPFLKKTSETDPKNLKVRIALAKASVAIGRFGDARKEAAQILALAPENEEGISLFVDTSRSKEEVTEAEELLKKLPEPDRAAWRLAKGVLLVRANDIPAAEKEVQKALALDPKSSAAHLAMAFIYTFRQDQENAGKSFRAAAEASPIRSNARIKLAEHLIQAGAIEEARKVLTEISQKAPDYLPAWSLLGQMAVQERKFDAALPLAENILRRDPVNLDGGLIQAQVWIAKRKSKEATEVLERLDKSYKIVPVVKYHLARAYVQSGKLPEATALLKQAIVMDPNYWDALLMLAEANLVNGNPQDVITSMQEVLRKRPSLTQAGNLLAEAYRVIGKLDQSANVFRNQIAKSPKNPAPHFMLALILGQQKKFPEARESLEKALELAPDNLLFVSQLVDLDLLDKDFDRAHKRVQGHLQKKGDLSGVYLLQGRVFAAEKKWDQAEAAILKAVEIAPDSSSAYQHLVSLYVSANKQDQALARMEAQLQKVPGDVRTLMGIAMLQGQLKNYEKARDAYEKLLAANPTFVPALNNLAYIYAENLNNPAKAVELAERARKEFPTDPSIADTLGWSLHKSGKFREALPLLTESAGKAPENAEIQFHLGINYYMLGQEQLALASLQRAVQGSEESPWRAEASKRIALLENKGGDADPATLATLEDLLKTRPNDLTSLLRLAGIYERTGASDKARQLYESARKLDPANPLILSRLAAVLAQDEKGAQQALALAKEAKRLAPDDIEISFLLGKLAQHAGEGRWASELLSEVAFKKPDNAVVQFLLARALLGIGKLNEAQDAMKKATASVPDSGAQPGNGALSPAQIAEGKEFVELVELLKSPEKRIESAVPALVTSVLKSRPNDLPALMLQAMIEAQNGRFQEARQLYEKLLLANADFATARKQLASLYTDHLGDQVKALEHATKARESLKDDPGLAKILGKIAYRQADYPNAIRYLQESSAKLPDDAEGFYFLGMGNYHRKLKEDSKAALERALSLSPEAPFAAEARKILAELGK